MSDPSNFRQERIEKLLNEIRYEVERGLYEHEIAEEMTFRFCFGISRKIPDGVVFCEFKTRPMPRLGLAGHPDLMQPRLRVVK